MLADLLAPLDYPRRSAYNLARSGGNVFTGDATWQDLLRALPAAGGLAATPFLGPLAGAGVAAGLQGLGGLVAPEAFAAPTAADLVGELGGDPESLLQTFGAQLATDPLTYAGGVGAVRAGRAASQQALRAGGPPSFRPGGPPGAPGTMPMQLGSGVPPPPAFGTSEYARQVQAAIEADAVASAAREAMPPPFQGVGDQPWVSPRPPAPVAPGELSPDLDILYGALGDIRYDTPAGQTFRPEQLQARVGLLGEIGKLEKAANPASISHVDASPFRAPAHLARLRAAEDEADTLGQLLHGGFAPRPEYPPLLRGVEWDTPMVRDIGRAQDDLGEVMSQIRTSYLPDPDYLPDPQFINRGRSALPGGIRQLVQGGVPPPRASALLDELEAAGLPIDRPRAVDAYRAGLDRSLNKKMARQLDRLAHGDPPVSEAYIRQLGLPPEAEAQILAELEQLAAGPLPPPPGHFARGADAYAPLTASLRQSVLDQALRQAGLL